MVSSWKGGPVRVNSGNHQGEIYEGWHWYCECGAMGLESDGTHEEHQSKMLGDI